MLFCLAALPSWQADSGAPLTPDPGIMTLDVALPSTSCTPPQQKVKQTLGGSDHSLGRASFFLHDEGEFNMSDVLDCLHDSFNVTEGADGFDGLPPDVEMHLTDMWLIDRLRSHPMRTYDVGSADFHVIGAPLASAWRTVTTVQTFLKSNKCGTWESHRIRANAIARRLKGMKQFQATRGRNFLLLNSYYFTSDALGPELLALLMTGPSLFTAADHFFKQSLPGGPLAKVNPIILPYKASPLAEASAWEDAPEERNRPIQYMFHGDLKRKCTPAQAAEGCKRDLILDLEDELHKDPKLNTSFNAFSYDKLLKRYEYNGPFKPDMFRDHQTFSHSKRMRSQFCLIPSGDTPTSRRLYDALASGCIPVVMAEFETYAINLPFQRSIDWPRMLIFAGSLPCLKNNIKPAANFMRSIAQLDVSAWRDAGLRAFRASLSYTKGIGLVDALLREVKSRLHSQSRPNEVSTALHRHLPPGEVESRAIDTVRPNLASLERVLYDGRDVTECNRCKSRRWLFLFTTRRVGTTTLLEALNSLPNVHLSGDSEATLQTAMEMLESSQRHRGPGHESVACKLQRWFVEGMENEVTLDDDSRPPILGFKVLVDPRNVLYTQKLHSFLQTVFPCAQYVFNLRTDVKKQASAQWFKTEGVDVEELQAVNDDFIARFTALGQIRSRLVYLDDYSNSSYDGVARWLGREDCVFPSLPEVDLSEPPSADAEHEFMDVSLATRHAVRAVCHQPVNLPVPEPITPDSPSKFQIESNSAFFVNAPRVFVLPLSKGWNQDLLECPKLQDRWQHEAFPYGNAALSTRTNSEADFETWFHQAMQHYPHLVSDASKAELIYVPAYGRRADVCSQTEAQHTELKKELAMQISDYHVWYPDAIFFMVKGAICSCKNLPCSPLADEAPAVSDSLHVMAWESRAPGEDGPSNIVVPYLTFTAKAERARALQLRRARDSAESSRDAKLRRTLVLNPATTEKHPNACLHCGVCTGSDAPEGGKCRPGCANIRQPLQERIAQYGNESLARSIGGAPRGLVAAMSDATFCLQPGGATLTRAALYQSIVYGCIPVVFREDFPFVGTLAYSETIPYRQLWVHIPEADVLAGEDFVQALRNVPQETITAKRALMRKYAPMLDWDCDMEQGCDAGSAAFQASLVASLHSARHVGRDYRTSKQLVAQVPGGPLPEPPPQGYASDAEKSAHEERLRAKEEASEKERAAWAKAEAVSHIKPKEEADASMVVDHKAGPEQSEAAGEGDEKAQKKKAVWDARTAASKLQKEEKSRRDKAEKKARAEHSRWFSEEKKRQTQNTAEAKRLSGNARQQAKQKEKARHNQAKAEEEAREKAEVKAEAEARRHAAAMQAKADADVEKAEAEVKAIIDAQDAKGAQNAQQQQPEVQTVWDPRTATEVDPQIQAKSKFGPEVPEQQQADGQKDQPQLQPQWWQPGQRQGQAEEPTGSQIGEPVGEMGEAWVQSKEHAQEVMPQQQPEPQPQPQQQPQQPQQQPKPEESAKLVDPGFEAPLGVEQVPGSLDDLSADDAAVVRKMMTQNDHAQQRAREEAEERSRVELAAQHRLARHHGHVQHGHAQHVHGGHGSDVRHHQTREGAFLREKRRETKWHNERPRGQ